jgi:hypothetical protein
MALINTQPIKPLTNRQKLKHMGGIGNEIDVLAKILDRLGKIEAR